MTRRDQDAEGAASADRAEREAGVVAAPQHGGRARIPIAATAAPTIPVIAAMMVQMTTVPTASPPDTRENHSSIAR